MPQVIFNYVDKPRACYGLGWINIKIRFAGSRLWTMKVSVSNFVDYITKICEDPQVFKSFSLVFVDTHFFTVSCVNVFWDEQANLTKPCLVVMVTELSFQYQQLCVRKDNISSPSDRAYLHHWSVFFFSFFLWLRINFQKIMDNFHSDISVKDLPFIRKSDAFFTSDPEITLIFDCYSEIQWWGFLYCCPKLSTSVLPKAWRWRDFTFPLIWGFMIGSS